MKTPFKPIIALGLFACLAGVNQDAHAASPPVITVTSAAQVAGTKNVLIQYNLTYSGTTPMTISTPLVSSNSGVLWNVPAYTFTGDIGPVAPGTGKAIVWYAGSDWNGQYTTNCRVRLQAQPTTEWTARDSSRNWWSVASSADGSKLVAAEGGNLSGQIYTSTDSGVSWTARDSSRNWYSVASSADGSKLVAVVNGGQIYTSTDSGVTWTPRDSSRGWQSVASSADGSKLVAVVKGGQIYTLTAW